MEKGLYDMATTCPGCGRPVTDEARDCPYCGTSHPEGPEPPEAPRQDVPGGRQAGRPEGQYAGQAYPGPGYDDPYRTPSSAPQYGGQYSGQHPGQYPGQQPYAQGSAPWYQPYQPYGWLMPCPGAWWWPYPPPYPPYIFPPVMYPGMTQPLQAQGLYPAGAPGRRRMRPLVIALIIIGVLLVVGGAVTVALLMTGNTSASYRLGDGRVMGADIDFREMTLKQEGETITLTGRYDNNSSYTGEVLVTIQAITGGQEQIMTFNVPVSTGTNRTFSQQKPAGSVKLKGATLSSLAFQGSSRFDTDRRDSYPEDSRQSQPSDSRSTSPGQSAPVTDEYEQDIYDEFPYQQESAPVE